MDTVVQVQLTRQRPLLKEQFSFCCVYMTRESLVVREQVLSSTPWRTKNQREGLCELFKLSFTQITTCKHMPCATIM